MGPAAPFAARNGWIQPSLLSPSSTAGAVEATPRVLLAENISTKQLLSDRNPGFDAISEVLHVNVQRMACIFAVDVLNFRPSTKWSWHSADEASGGAAKEGWGRRERSPYAYAGEQLERDGNESEIDREEKEVSHAAQNRSRARAGMGNRQGSASKAKGRDASPDRLEQRNEKVGIDYEERYLETLQELMQMKLERKQQHEERLREEEKQAIEAIKRDAVRDEKVRVAKEAAAKRAAVEEWNLKSEKEAKEAQEERKRIIEEFEKKKTDYLKMYTQSYQLTRQDTNIYSRKHAQEQAVIAKLKSQEESKKAKEQSAWEEFQYKQRNKRARVAAEKKQREDEAQAILRERLSMFGFQENQIQEILKPEMSRDGPTSPDPFHAPQAYPTFAKVHRDHIALETLQYYDLPLGTGPGNHADRPMLFNWLIYYFPRPTRTTSSS